MSRLVALGMINVLYRPEATLAQRRAELLELVDQAGRDNCQIVALPEFADHHRTLESIAAYQCGISAYLAVARLEAGDPWLNALAALAAKHRMVVMPNVLFLENGTTYNRMLVYGPAGQLLDKYDKTHPAPYENRVFTRGHVIKPIETPFAKIGPLICYDINFPELMRCYELLDAELLVWTTMRQGEHEEALYHTILPARALEYGMPLAVACYSEFSDLAQCRTMSSAVFSPQGVMLAGGMRTAGVLKAIVDLDQRPLTRRTWDSRQFVDHRAFTRRGRRPDLYEVLLRPLGAGDADPDQAPTVATFPE